MRDTLLWLILGIGVGGFVLWISGVLIWAGVVIVKDLKRERRYAAVKQEMRR